MKTKKELDNLKKEYLVFEKKYKLPKFSELNVDFEIEKLQGHETDFLLREIRRIINEKINAFLRLFELFLTPQSAPLFLLSAIKNLSPEEKEKIEKIYKKIMVFEIKAISLDIDYSEKKEADFIKEISSFWNNLKIDLKIIDEVLSRIKEETIQKKNKSYFG